MTIRSTVLALVVTCAAVPALAGGSGQHFAQSADHSALAASHGSAATGSAAAAVVAVPVVVVGGALAITGAALTEVGGGSLAAGTDLSRAAAGHQPVRTTVQPNAAPTLD